MASLPAVLSTFVVAALGVIAGCSDNAEELEALRNQQGPPKQTTGTGTETPVVSGPGGGYGPGATPPGTVPGPGGSCQPQQAAGVAPAWRPPSPLHRGQCTPQDAMNVVTCYIGQQQAACDAQVSPQCLLCIVSDVGFNQTYGPIIFDKARPQAVEVNVEGCVAAMSGDTSATGCGAKMKQSESCKAQACAACSDQAALGQCLAAAAAGPCAAYAAAAQCAQPHLATCQRGTSAVEVAYSLAQLFCM